MSCILYKYPEEIRVYAFDFADQVEIADGAQTLASGAAITATLVSGPGTTALVVGSVTISGTKIQATVSGGTFGDVFEMRGSVVTSASATIAARGQLEISRPC